MLKSGDLLNQRYKIIRQIASGGFSLIFEAQDIYQRNFSNGFGLQSSKAVKILKIFHYSGHQQPEAEFLFRRESALLKQLSHPQIVKYIDDFDLVIGQSLVPCLVLGKAVGVNLDDWLRQNGAIPEALALDWLSQCANILSYLHVEKQIIHLDIKPSNFILTISGELVLIDFGIARPLSETFIAKMADEGDPQAHRAGTHWYMAPEQFAGRPNPRSDLYALGRTIIQALANQPPDQIAEDDEGGWLWDEFAPHLSPALSSLLEDMTTHAVAHRLADARTLTRRIDHIIQTYYADPRSPLVQYVHNATRAITTSLLITGLVAGGKFLGLLQPLELYVYDQLVRLRPDTEGPDPRMLIIKVTPEDLRRQRELNIRDSSSLSNIALQQLLAKIQPHNPAVIGLDIYREDPLPEGAGPSLIAGCSISSNESPDHQIPPPPGLAISQVGFFDMPFDPDGRIRRQFLGGGGLEHCDPTYSFSYQVAKAYLKKHNVQVIEDEHIELNNRVLPRLRNRQALYANISDSGYQVFLNYRTYRNAAQSVSLYDILDDRISPDELASIITNKIILIGTTDATFQDDHETPYGQKRGVIIQAHKISHLINLSLDERGNISFLPRLIEVSWIFLISLLGISIRLKRPIQLFLGLAFPSALFLVVTYIAFILNGFFSPTIPSLLVIFLLAGMNLVKLNWLPKSHRHIGYKVHRKNFVAKAKSNMQISTDFDNKKHTLSDEIG